MISFQKFHLVWRATLAAAASLAVSACATVGGGGAASLTPAVTASSDAERADEVSDVLDRALARKDPASLKRAARALVKRKHDAEAARQLRVRLREGLASAPESELRAAVDLYVLLPDPDVPRLFVELIHAPRLEVRRLAWQIAASHPSDGMANAVGAELSRRAEGSGRAAGLSPEAALAARANDLKDSYPLLRAALLEEGHVAYARAMIGLNPVAASDDLLTYLGQERPSRAVVLLALAHLRRQPPSLHHPNFRQLFHYAAEKDAEVADAATALLAQYVAHKEEHFAFLLAQLPLDVQNRFLERLRRHDEAVFARFYETLRPLSPDAGE